MIDSRLRQRQEAYRNRKLLDACREQTCYLRLQGCTGSPTAACHSNLLRLGRGHAYKSHDVYTIPACLNCGREFDHGKQLNKADREIIWCAAWEKWQLEMWRQGLVRVA